MIHERSILKRGLADISDLFISRPASMPPADGAAPARVAALVADAALGPDTGWIEVWERAAASFAVAGRLASPAPADSPPTHPDVSGMRVADWAGFAWPEAAGSVVDRYARIAVALPPDAAAFARAYGVLKRLGPLRRRRSFFYLLVCPAGRLASLDAIDDAWQAVVGRFLDTPVLPLGQVFAAAPPPAVWHVEPRWRGLRRLLAPPGATDLP